MLTEQEIPLLLLLGVLFLAAMFLAAAETAHIRIPRVRAETMAKEGVPGAARVARLVDDLPRVLNGILLAALLVQVGAATVTGLLAQRLFGSLGVTIASVVLTVVLFIYTEAIPKTFAVQHSERVARWVAGPVAALELVLRPVVSLLVWIADLQMPGKGITTSPTVTEAELRHLADRAAREGEITEEDLTLIDRAFRLGDRRADDVMVPRTDIVAVEADLSVEEALRMALAAGHRRLPVYDDTLDQVVGVVKLRDLAAVADGQPVPLRELLEPPLVVPESKRVVELLREMQRSGTHLAMVVDEYGGIAGLVTVEDIAEELLGTISDEGEPQAPVRELDEGHWMVDGGLPVEDLEDLVEVQLPEGDWNTVAGLVLGLLGRLPRPGDELEIDGHRLRAAEVRGRRITRVEAWRTG